MDEVDLADDIDALRAMLVASQVREARKDERIERLEKLVAAFKQAAFGRKSEKSDPEQFDLALEDLQTAMAAVHAEDEADSSPGKPQRSQVYATCRTCWHITVSRCGCQHATLFSSGSS